jgi:hypothetical protein
VIVSFFSTFPHWRIAVSGHVILMPVTGTEAVFL